MLTVQEFPDRLKAARLRKHRHSQDAAALALGVGQKAVSNWETGKTLPSPVHYKAVAKYLGLPEAQVANAIDTERMTRGRRLTDPMERIEHLEAEVAEMRDELAAMRGASAEQRELIAEVLAEYRRRRR